MTADIIKSNDNAIQSGSDFNIPKGYICTLDIASIAGKIKLANAINGAESMRDKVGEVLRVVDVVTTKGTRARTGEPCVNTYLILDDDSVFFSQSDGIASSAGVLVGILTDQTTGEFQSPVDLGLGFMIKELEMSNGNTLKKMVLVELDS